MDIPHRYPAFQLKRHRGKIDDTPDTSGSFSAAAWTAPARLP
jgi:hypothetical protein